MDAILHAQGDEYSTLTPLILIHAISGLALPYFALGSLFDDDRRVYGISSPLLSTTNGDNEKYIPKSIDELASLYIQLIKKEIQPRGPYLLGGWSFGGMLAAEMANMLLEEGEEILHVFLIDSTNPGTYPPYMNAQEHRHSTALTYNAMAERVGGTQVNIWDDNLDPSRSSVSSESTSYTSSDDRLRDDIGGESMASSSRSSQSDSSEDPDEEDFSNRAVIKDIRAHIGYGLSLMSNAVDLDVPSVPTSQDGNDAPICTLIRCEKRLPPSININEPRRKWMQKIGRDPYLGWRPRGVHDLNVMPLEGTSHDECFDSGHAERLTMVLRKALRGIGI